MDDFTHEQYEDIRLHMSEYFRDKTDCDNISSKIDEKVDNVSIVVGKHDKDISNIIMLLKIMGILVASFMGTSVFEKIVSLF